MNANVPTDILFSFSGLARRGGDIGPHKDGWGVSFYDGRRCRSFHDMTPCCSSELAKFLSSHPIKSEIVIAHIRQATHGKVSLANTHPFIRTHGSRSWSFAHNGKLPAIKKIPLRGSKPVGTTDSEYAFCWLMEQLQEKYANINRVKPVTLWRYIEARCHELHAMGSANILLSDSRYLFAYCSTKLYWITRRAPFSIATLKSDDHCIDFSVETTENDVVSCIATDPLTDDERWVKMDPGTLVVFHDGEVVYQSNRSK